MKSRPSWRQDLIWRAEALGFDAATGLLRLFPVAWVSSLGAALFKALGPITKSHRIAERNIRLAFPDLSAADRAALMRAQWDNLGRTFFEFPLTHRLTPASGRVEVVGRERLEAVAASGAPAVIVTGHFANWEVIAIAIMDAGVPCRITYRAANNPYVDRRIRAIRERYGVRLFAPKGGEGAKDILEAMGRGESVALLNDQKFNEGVAAPFFGHPAHTATGPTRLGLKAGRKLLPMSAERLGGARFRVTAHEPILLDETGDRALDLQAGVTQVNAFVEARVREHPDQWFWVHKRWPVDAYRELDQADGA
jgi:KDO2-lipid IV(A) lauroyltransferase